MYIVIFLLSLDDQSENPFDWKDVSTDDIFANKRVVVFALPGAFTPTCSSTHLPGYEADYAAIKAAGVDEVYCLSVNDAFVMRKWGLDQGLPEDKETGNFQNVKLLPDGAAAFTRGMGLTCTWTKVTHPPHSPIPTYQPSLSVCLSLSVSHTRIYIYIYIHVTCAAHVTLE